MSSAAVGPRPHHSEVTHYAVPDPHDPMVMTYWREERGRRKAWPTKTTYGPRLLRTDIPDGLQGPGLVEFYRTWAESNLAPWWTALQADIDHDPAQAQARFATLTTRCCRCGRKLISPTSKLDGIGPECRSGIPAAMLRRLRDAVRRAHAAVPQGNSTPSENLA